MSISCVYCGGSHARPADVKACWQRSSGGEAAPAARLDEGSVPAQVPVSEVVATVEVPLRRGPEVLGRNVIVGVGQAAPPEWEGCERVAVDSAELADAASILADLRQASVAAVSVVIELALEFEAQPSSATDEPPYAVGARFTFVLDELHHLMWSNSIDARVGATGRWALVDRAVALGARPVEDGPGDVVAPDGEARWLDGGPARYQPPVDGAAVVHAVVIEHGSLAAPSSNDTAADLAPDQLAAVTHLGGPARIIAPAGSGKTRVLTERARHLITRWNLPPSAVSLVAFNKRAQVEMRERTADLPGLDARTFNSIALAIVNGRAPFAPQAGHWRTLDDFDVRSIIGKLVTVPKRRNTDPIAPWIDALSLLRLGLRSPEQVENEYDGDVAGLTEVWPKYRRELERAGAIDFDDQIYRAIEVLLTQPTARAAAQRACRVLLVDEFQDLTPAHLLLVRLLAAPGGAVFGVGDDDQTIYGYKRADPASLIDFADLFPGAGDHPLEVNYRCPGGIVTAADRLLRYNRRRVAKTIRAASSRADGYTVSTSDDPVSASVGAVEQALASGAAPADVAVLTRVNAIMAPVQVALSQAGVPISGGVGAEFADRTSVRAVFAWLRLATAARFAADDIVEALRRPSRPLHPRITDWASEQTDVDGLRRLAGRLNTERDAERVGSFADDIERLRTRAGRGASTLRLVDTLIDDFGLAGSVAGLDANRRGMNRSAQSDDLVAVRHLAALHPEVATFESWLRSQLMTKRDPDGVLLATVHRVKGLEWPHVVVHLADADQFPHRLADDTEEERRLFHVAITRASDTAIIVTSEDPSPFVHQLIVEPPEHLPEEPELVPQRAAEKRRGTRPSSDHPLLQRGRVMAVAGLVLIDQGSEWTVVEVEPSAAVAEHGSTVRRFGLGDRVETRGKQRGDLAARNGDVGERSVLAFDELRVFRNDARGGKPAYTVFDDKTLAAIASALPDSLPDLARVKGVGPAKLEQYGDAILAVVAAV